MTKEGVELGKIGQDRGYAKVAVGMSGRGKIGVKKRMFFSKEPRPAQEPVKRVSADAEQWPQRRRWTRVVLDQIKNLSGRRSGEDDWGNVRREGNGNEKQPMGHQESEERENFQKCQDVWVKTDSAVKNLTQRSRSCERFNPITRGDFPRTPSSQYPSSAGEYSSRGGRRPQSDPPRLRSVVAASETGSIRHPERLSKSRLLESCPPEYACYTHAGRLGGRDKIKFQRPGVPEGYQLFSHQEMALAPKKSHQVSTPGRGDTPKDTYTAPTVLLQPLGYFGRAPSSP
ncbi:unnamed protein product [Discosporangium mesarthrocarpum]